MRLSTEWRRCESMTFDRADFFAVSGPNSHYIYVFGGTTKEEDKQIIEKYNCRDNIWEVL
jgi:hypothetical protein